MGGHVIMTNYNELIKNAVSLDELKSIVDRVNNDKMDNAEMIFSESELISKAEKFTEANKKAFSIAFAVAIDADRIKAFTDLLKNQTYTRITVKKDNDTKKLSIDDTKTALFRFADLEKEYQTRHAKTTKNDSTPMPNKDVSIFGATRFYGLCDCFIRNLLETNLVIDENKVYNLSKVKIDNQTIFTEKDGECFSSNSNNALEKQLNLLVRFMGLDVKMLKKDLPALRIFAQKVKRDTTGKTIIRETKTLAFADILFGVITARANGETVKAYTNNGKVIEFVQDKPAGITLDKPAGITLDNDNDIVPVEKAQ